MMSVIITAYKEEKTIGKAIKAILENNLDASYEVIVIAPDQPTRTVASSFNVRTLKDPGKGKPHAMNIAAKAAKGDILVWTDGDVHMSRNALHELKSKLDDPTTGAVSGRPVSISDSNTMLGFWSTVLSTVAHERRLRARHEKKKFFCSGYLFAIRKSLFPKLDEEILSEDGLISHKVYQQGFTIAYAPKAEVYVKYPSTFQDWITQKRRSAGGYNQIKILEGIEIRSFKKESFGVLGVIKHAKNSKEMIWMTALLLARVYLWAIIYQDINIKKKHHREIWKRVESTK